LRLLFLSLHFLSLHFQPHGLDAARRQRRRQLFGEEDFTAWWWAAAILVNCSDGLAVRWFGWRAEGRSGGDGCGLGMGSN
jgi:hypothetical protein